MPKSGFKTSEFWVMLIQALVGPIIMLCVVAGVFVPGTDTTALSDSLSANLGGAIQAILAIFASLNSLRAVRGYTEARTEIKKGGKE